MLATAWPAPFDDEQWVFELKWDGVRCILTSANGVVLTSRTGNDMTARYPGLARLALPDDLVLDGEIVALDDAGHPSFELLQSRMNVVPSGGAMVPITYVVFDLLVNGTSTLHLPLEERTAQLRGLDLPPPIVVADSYPASSAAIWSFVQEHDLEGIVAKRLGSRYVPGSRSPDWRKVGHFKQLRAVVGGYTPGSGGRAATFGSLLLGLVDDDKLRWIGAVGSGFDDQALRAIRSALDEMRVVASPFHDDPAIPAGSTWVEPRLVAMVRYKQWTAAGRVRAPSFKGFTDAPAATVTWQSEGPGAR
ncbi:MAG: non-homologous end-joining DNA ligase [Acidimicrobiia bacterium]|nr:non-homologous end-joining DNA ligase [Acidimicrobiia bacterium]